MIFLLANHACQISLSPKRLYNLVAMQSLCVNPLEVGEIRFNEENKKYINNSLLFVSSSAPEPKLLEMEY